MHLRGKLHGGLRTFDRKDRSAYHVPCVTVRADGSAHYLSNEKELRSFFQKVVDTSCETNSNFGFNLPWWDRLFGTYRDQPAAGHEAMAIGIEQFRDPAELHLDRMLLQPLRDGSGPYPLGREKGG